MLTLALYVDAEFIQYHNPAIDLVVGPFYIIAGCISGNMHAPKGWVVYALFFLCSSVLAYGITSLIKPRS